MTPKSPQPSVPATPVSNTQDDAHKPVPEIGGRKGPEPTRYNDWEKDGKCVDF